MSSSAHYRAPAELSARDSLAGETALTVMQLRHMAKRKRDGAELYDHTDPGAARVAEAMHRMADAIDHTAATIDAATQEEL